MGELRPLGISVSHTHQPHWDRRTLRRTRHMVLTSMEERQGRHQCDESILPLWESRQQVQCDGSILFSGPSLEQPQTLWMNGLDFNGDRCIAAGAEGLTKAILTEAKGERLSDFSLYCLLSLPSVLLILSHFILICSLAEGEDTALDQSRGVYYSTFCHFQLWLGAMLEVLTCLPGNKHTEGIMQKECPSRLVCFSFCSLRWETCWKFEKSKIRFQGITVPYYWCLFLRPEGLSESVNWEILSFLQKWVETEAVWGTREQLEWPWQPRCTALWWDGHYSWGDLYAAKGEGAKRGDDQ